MSQYVTLMGAEDVRRAGAEMSAAAEQMQRAANQMESNTERLVISLNDHAMRLGDLLNQEPVKPSLRRVIVSKRIWNGTGQHLVEIVGPAVFHQWGSEFEEFEAGPGNVTVAIVEFPDGRIQTALPQDLRFEVQP